jgi:hypothetical protein
MINEYLTKEDCRLLIKLLQMPGYQVNLRKEFSHPVEDTSYALEMELEVQGLWFDDLDTDVAWFSTDRIFQIKSTHVRVMEVNVLYKGPNDWYRRWIGKWREIELPDLPEIPECTNGDLWHT